uniref:Uncharacterized protein n=1 Tax=Brassica oleracea TaxID=3712 RepID=A0A3P6AR40_BRAOL|nr:unnamed protein product [Brassica oleracea]
MGVESLSTGEYSSKATNHSLLFSRAISSSSLREREREREREGKSEEYADSIQFRVRDSSNLET